MIYLAYQLLFFKYFIEDIDKRLKEQLLRFESKNDSFTLNISGTNCKNTKNFEVLHSIVNASKLLFFFLEYKSIILHINNK